MCMLVKNSQREFFNGAALISRQYIQVRGFIIVFPGSGVSGVEPALYLPVKKGPSYRRSSGWNAPRLLNRAYRSYRRTHNLNSRRRCRRGGRPRGVFIGAPVRDIRQVLQVFLQVLRNMSDTRPQYESRISESPKLRRLYARARAREDYSPLGFDDSTDP